MPLPWYNSSMENTQQIKWTLVHTYRRAAEQGHVESLLCPFDQGPLVSAFDTNDDPMLKCYSCKTDFHLEDPIFEKMVTVLEEAERLR